MGISRGQSFREGKFRTAFLCFALRSIDITNPPPGGRAMNLQAPLGGDAKGRKPGMLAHANARLQPLISWVDALLVPAWSFVILSVASRAFCFCAKRRDAQSKNLSSM